ncbi:MAG: hypothetical protein OEL88_02385 [Sterolibacteriaceae bacterium MAG5]|nr:hypothetical protein [Candidatus Nitricoxidireducens bremensis]
MLDLVHGRIVAFRLQPFKRQSGRRYRPEKHAAVGTKAAVAMFFGKRLQKSKRTSTTNWANPRLTERQMLYAAADAQVALKVYRAWRQGGAGHAAAG